MQEGKLVVEEPLRPHRTRASWRPQRGISSKQCDANFITGNNRQGACVFTYKVPKGIVIDHPIVLHMAAVHLPEGLTVRTGETKNLVAKVFEQVWAMRAALDAATVTTATEGIRINDMLLLEYDVQPADGDESPDLDDDSEEDEHMPPCAALTAWNDERPRSGVLGLGMVPFCSKVGTRHGPRPIRSRTTRPQLS